MTLTALPEWPIRSRIITTTIINSTKCELAELDRQTRKLLTIHGALHPRFNISGLYLPRREGGRGLISGEDAINTEISMSTSARTRNNCWKLYGRGRMLMKLKHQRSMEKDEEEKN